jgi:uncharacterized membrane protein YfcA
MLTGMSLPAAVAISLAAAAVQNGVAAWQLRREIDLPATIRPMLLRFATLPLGVLALWWLGEENKNLASQLVGVLVLGIVALQQSLRVQPRPVLHPGWEWLTFSVAGFLVGLCGMGGPPMVLWVLAHDWPMNRARAFLYFLFVTGLPLQAVLLWLVFGPAIVSPMLLGLAALPALLLGLYAGLYLSKLLPDALLRRLSVALLVVVALAAIVSPYLT